MEYEINSIIDHTAMILCNLKNSPSSSPASSPPSSPISQNDQQLLPQQCECMLCERSTPLILTKCHTWAWIMRVVFYSLKERYPDKVFFSLKNDVYEYMIKHWGILRLDKKPSANWHKQIQDMLSHSRNLFESGMNHFKQNGFWRLKDLEDPWMSKPEATRTVSPPLSPKKRTSSDSDIEEMAQSPSKKICMIPLPVPTAPLSLSHPQFIIPLQEQLSPLSDNILSPNNEYNNNTPSYISQTIYHHNRAWEDSYPMWEESFSSFSTPVTA